MKSATLSLLASATLALSFAAIGSGVLTACADSSADPIPNTGSSTSGTEPAADGGAAPASDNGNGGGGGGGGGSQPKACAPSCKVDTDCSNSCGAISGASWCCDTKMSQCFSTKAAMCPVPTDNTDPDAGPMAAY